MPEALPHRATPRPPRPASSRPVSTARAPALRSVLRVQVRDLVGTLRMTPAVAELLQQAAGIRPQRRRHGDREEVDRQEQDSRRQQPRQAHLDHGEGSDWWANGGEAAASAHRSGRPDEIERVRPSAGREQLALAATHPVRLRIGQIVVSAEMQQAVDDVERQLVSGIAPDLRGRGRRHLGRDDELAGEDRVIGLGEREADHVRRPVVAQVGPVDRVDRRLVDERDRDRRPPMPLGDQDRADERRQLRAVDSQVALRVAELHLDPILRIGPVHHRLPAFFESCLCRNHAVRCSGYLTRPW